MSATVWAYPWDLVDEGVFPEGGVIYFRPRGNGFHGQAIQPVLSHLLDGADPLEEVTRECHRRGMTATAWVVLAHNTRLAQHYQEYQVRNAFGDGFAYCLCPAQPATRDYILALIGELVASYDVDVVECFCPACQRLLREEGIDSEPLQARVRDAVDRGFDQGPADASRVEEIFRQDAELWTLVTKRVQTVTALIADIAALVHARGKKLFCFAPVFVEPASLDWVEGTQARRLAPLVDCWELALYSPDQPERVARAQRAASLAGIEHIGFYNYGVLPQARLGWLSQAAEAFRS